MMTSAMYGRMNHGRCIRKGFDEHGNPDPIGCSEDILRYFVETYCFSWLLHFRRSAYSHDLPIHMIKVGSDVGFMSRVQKKVIEV